MGSAIVGSPDSGVVGCHRRRWAAATAAAVMVGALTVLVPGAVGPVDPAAADPPQTASTSITAGANHTCALTAAGAVKCWGANDVGQLGNGTTTASPTPVAVTGLASGVTAVTAGDYHTCAVTAPGAVKCWGTNGNGQLGNGTTVDSSTPVAVSGLASGVTAVTAGGFHTCALTAAGAVKCWGYNGYGELGDGTTVDSSTPVAVSGLASGVTAVAAGYMHTCAVTDAGAAKCWGRNVYGGLGDGTATNSSTPVAVSGLASGVTAVTAGFYHSCAATDAGAVKCWGNNALGQLGNGTTVNSSTPVAVTGLASGVTAVTAGANHTCALTDAGALECWGNNASGQLGNGTTTNSSTPVDVTGRFGPPAPGLSVTKTADESTVEIGDTVHLHVTVTNTGNVALTDVTVVDANAPDCDATIASLAVGADTTVDCSYVATAADLGTYSNTASVTAEEVTTAVVSNQVDVAVTIPAAGGTVAGTITESATAPSAAAVGDPLAGMLVAGFGSTGVAGEPLVIRGTQTDAAGGYALTVPGGEYGVSFVDPTGGHVFERYNDTTDPAGFTLSTVTSGATTTIDAALYPQTPPAAANPATITGTVTDGSGAVGGAWVVAVDSVGDPARVAIAAGDGTFTLDELTAGDWRLIIVDPAGGHPVEWFADGVDWNTATVTPLAAGETVTGIDPVLDAP